MSTAAPPPGWRHFLLTPQGWPYLLVPFIPLAIVLELRTPRRSRSSSSSALGVIPTAALMGRATEELAARSGPGIGGLLNVTFGNAPELIIAFFALNKGLHEVVKASLVGSIMGNILLVLGAAMLVGGWGRDRQRFDRTAASAQSSMLLLATAALVMPAIFELVDGQRPAAARRRARRLRLDRRAPLARGGPGAARHLRRRPVFSLRTHRDLFNPPHDDDDESTASRGPCASR